MTGGAGGALIANDAVGAAMLEAVRARLPKPHGGWRELGKAAAQWLLARPATYGAISALPFLRMGETIYRTPHGARSLSRASSRMVANVWSAAQADTSIRRAHAARLSSAAQSSQHWRTIAIAPCTVPGYLRLPLLVATASRDAVMTPSAIRLGVMPGYPLPLSQLPGFRDRCVNANDRFPGAELLAKCLITLPTHRILTNKDMESLERWLEHPTRHGNIS
jgi:hypothetical protein